MSEIHINRAGQNLGVFSKGDVQAGLNTGKYLGTDLGWQSGMENWKPLADFSDLTVPTNLPPPVSPGFAPGVPPAMTAPLGMDLAAMGAGDLPSWEQKAQLGFLQAFGATVKEVLVEPGLTFSRMKESGGFTTPFLFMLLATMVGTVLAVGVQIGLQGVMGSALAQNPEVAKAFGAQGIGMGVGVLAMLIVLPIFLYIGSFIGSGIWHASLTVLGGANKPYEATYRVYAYVTGSSALVSLVPCCGGLAALVWKIVSGSIGLSKVHGISTGKAVFAVLLPLILCCGFCGVGFYFFYHSMAGNPAFMSEMDKLMKNFH